MKNNLIALSIFTLASLAGCATGGMSGSTAAPPVAQSAATMTAKSDQQMRAECGPGLAPNAPIGEAGRLGQGATASAAGMDRAACARIGITPAPNPPIGQPGMLSAAAN